jgi:hypothetical protein
VTCLERTRWAPARAGRPGPPGRLPAVSQGWRRTSPPRLVSLRPPNNGDEWIRQRRRRPDSRLASKPGPPRGHSRPLRRQGAGQPRQPALRPRPRRSLPTRDVERMLRAVEVADAPRAGRPALRERAFPRAALSRLLPCRPPPPPPATPPPKARPSSSSPGTCPGPWAGSEWRATSTASRPPARGPRLPPGPRPLRRGRTGDDRGPVGLSSGWRGPSRAGLVARVDWGAGPGRVRMEDVRDAAAAARAGRAVERLPAARWGEVRRDSLAVTA